MYEKYVKWTIQEPAVEEPAEGPLTTRISDLEFPLRVVSIRFRVGMCFVRILALSLIGWIGRSKISDGAKLTYLALGAIRLRLC